MPRPLIQDTIPPDTITLGHAATTTGGNAGLYDPAYEHDACGVGLVADLSGRRGHEIVARALTVLANLDHRGAKGADPCTGDGAGILTQVPDEFFRAACDFALPPAGHYAAGMAFLPRDDGPAGTAGSGEAARRSAREQIEQLAADEGLVVLGWRAVPHDEAACGSTARAVLPDIRQLFVASAAGEHGRVLDRRAYCLRQRAEHETAAYFVTLSSATIGYKGMLTATQLEQFYPDLLDPRFTSAIALAHSRFSTNTFPSWPLAHPFRFIAHNGEINTIRGNRNWWRAREAMLESDLFPPGRAGTAGTGAGLGRLLPVIDDADSDSASFDKSLELLYLAGRSLPHAVLMMIPQAWENDERMPAELRAFYRFHASLMEPWDGPALIAFTDGTLAGAVLDRNGLRPGRYWVTDDGLVVLASEVGVLDLDPARIVRKGRLQPGRIFLIDTASGRIVEDEEIKAELAAEHPYDDWLHAGLLHLDDLPDRVRELPGSTELAALQRLFGYTEEERRVVLGPMAASGSEPIGSMGDDTPLAVLSDRNRLLFDYFSQQFAQVTNPPLDAIREEVVTSLAAATGPEYNILAPGPASCRQIVLPYPVLSDTDLAKIVHINEDRDLPGFAAHVVDGRYPAAGGGEALRARLAEIRAEVTAAIGNGAKIIVLSDRGTGDDGRRGTGDDGRLAPIPSLLLTGAVHHHLIAERSRTRVGLVVEAGDVRETHHIALLIGYGAAGVCPYLAIETAADLARAGLLEGVSVRRATANLIRALGKGLMKIMSKMGVSTVASYTGAQIFEAIGLGPEVIGECFAGTSSRLGGIGFDQIAAGVSARLRLAYPDRPAGLSGGLESGGEYFWRRDGVPHLFSPEAVFRLQHATRSGQEAIFRQYSEEIDDQSARSMTLRGLLALRPDRAPVPLEEVEPVEAIVRRFCTGAMSYGSLSAEAHQTLAIAMNRLGGRSNSGEGGEDADRYVADVNGDLRRSAIKQVASGRFGVTSEYLVNADDLQIKMSQGAKPGEGGQLPAHKVYPWIAKTRHSTPGVGLISPPPHHDIYSIEDLAQLIYDLKNANPAARVSVKLVAEVGVGTIAAGVAKAHSDVILISGHDGGTGAAPLTSIKHAGAPWELGLAETQQTLLRNGLRDRVVVQVDGQLKTGRDVIIAALLGAEEYGFATAPLVVAGCVMMRACHQDTCPVGVATQNPELRQRYSGKPDFVVRFFEFVAGQVRQYLASLGFRTMDEAVGHAELLVPAAPAGPAGGTYLDLAPLLAVPALPPGASRRRTTAQRHGLDVALDKTLIQLAEGALEEGRQVHLELPVRNVNRTVGTMLGYEVTKRWGGEGLPDNTIVVSLAGSAGQSLGAFLPRGITIRLSGDANDYVGKGLSGGRIVIVPDQAATFAAHEQIIAGNVIGYGATSGELFVRGVVGERFCVRNSGAVAVTEGAGDHGCEYMTGGRVAVLGPVGRNFGAGMSGGIAYLLDADPGLVNTQTADIEALSEDDVSFLHDLIGRYHASTCSPVAARLLDDWLASAGRFRRVMPRDYKRVLAATRRAEQDGMDVSEAVMTAVRA
ncbi:MAG TPA: glutamate synthase large subunit [Streptosporangiaceae bacterium]|nr:glutamate synthase large subunit [Streptosporangiaceae bacterium]